MFGFVGILFVVAMIDIIVATALLIVLFSMKLVGNDLTIWQAWAYYVGFPVVALLITISGLWWAHDDGSIGVVIFAAGVLIAWNISTQGIALRNVMVAHREMAQQEARKRQIQGV